MRVLIVNTNEKTGGAAVAANRLMEALKNNGVKAMMLVRDKESDNISVAALPHRWLRQWPFLWERFVVFLHNNFSREGLFDIDIANAGTDITTLREFKEADVIHLSWVNQGMLSLANIRKILESDKPVVWTMHDAWPATAICHYTRGCQRYRARCQSCRMLPGGGSPHDLAARVWNAKKRMLADHNIHFVACSRWLEGEAKASALLAGQSVTSIPNPIDTRIYRPLPRREARMAAGLPLDKRVVLFVSQRVTAVRKGMNYFAKAMSALAASDPTFAQTTCVAVLGGHAEEVTDQLGLPAFPLGYVNDERRIVEIYSSADVYVLPSLEDNLPNTIMEAMACGVPCVGFRVGGIPEMIDHQRNGYVAKLRSATDLANGIRWVLDEADHDSLSQDAIRKVVKNYSQRSVALKYIDIYNQALAFKRYRL